MSIENWASAHDDTIKLLSAVVTAVALIWSMWLAKPPKEKLRIILDNNDHKPKIDSTLKLIIQNKGLLTVDLRPNFLEVYFPFQIFFGFKKFIADDRMPSIKISPRDVEVLPASFLTISQSFIDFERKKTLLSFKNFVRFFKLRAKSSSGAVFKVEITPRARDVLRKSFS